MSVQRYNHRRAYHPQSRTSTLAADSNNWQEKDRDTLLIASLPTYAQKTLFCDRKVRLQYIDYLKFAVKELSLEFIDQPGPYFDLIIDKPLPDELPIEETPIADFADSSTDSITTASPAAASPPVPGAASIGTVNRTSSISNAVIPANNEPRSFRLLNTSGFVTTYTELPDGSRQYGSPEQLPPTTTVEEITPSSRRLSSTISQRSPLFSYVRIVGYIMSKIKHSKEEYEKDGKHCFCLDGMLDRFLPSLRRQMMYECRLLRTEFNQDQFNSMKTDLINNLEHYGLPIHNKDYFPLLRPMTAYFANVFPQGKAWFTAFMTYISILHFGPRGGCVFYQTWGSIDRVRHFNHETNGEVLEEVCLLFDHFKGHNTVMSTNYNLLAYDQISPDHKQFLLTSPCPVWWLNALMKERSGGLSLIEFMAEKSTGGPNYERLKDCYIFASTRDDKLSTSFLDQEKRSCSLSIVFNEHLRQVATYCGFDKDLVSKLTLHQSIRRGAMIESEVQCRRNNIPQEIRNVNWGWRSNSTIGNRQYDPTACHQLHNYANVMFALLESDLPNHVTLQSFMPSSDTVFTHNHLVDYLKKKFNLGNSKLVTLPPAETDKTMYAIENFDLLKTIIHSIQGNCKKLYPNKKCINSLDDMHHSIVLAAHALRELQYTPVLDRDFKDAKRYLLSRVTYKRVDMMGTFFYESILPYSDIHKSWNEKMVSFNNRLPLVSASVPSGSVGQRPLLVSPDPNASPRHTDQDVKFAIRAVNDMSLYDLFKVVKSIHSSQTNVTSLNSSSPTEEQLGMWDIVSYYLFSDVKHARTIKGRASYKKFGSDLILIKKEMTMTTDENVLHEKCISSRNKHSPWSEIETKELMAFFHSFPYLRSLYGWGNITLAFCPTLLKGGLTTQQIKDKLFNELRHEAMIEQTRLRDQQLRDAHLRRTNVKRPTASIALGGTITPSPRQVNTYLQGEAFNPTRQHLRQIAIAETSTLPQNSGSTSIVPAQTICPAYNMSILQRRINAQSVSADTSTDPLSTAKDYTSTTMTTMTTSIPSRCDEELCQDEQRKRPRLSASTGTTTAKNLLGEFNVASRITPSHKKSIVVYELSDDSSSSGSLLVNNNHGRSNTYSTPIIMLDDSDDDDKACVPVRTTTTTSITTVRGGSDQPFPCSDNDNFMSDSDDSVDHMISSLRYSHEQNNSVYKTDKSITAEESIIPSLPSMTGNKNSSVFIIDAVGKIHSNVPVPVPVAVHVNPNLAVVDENNFDGNGLQKEFPARREHNGVQRLIGVDANHLNGPGNNPGPIQHGPAPLLVNPPGIIPVYTGGFNYLHRPTLTFTAANHNGLAAINHGLLQGAHQGHGLPVDHNHVVFSSHGRFVPALWIEPVVLGQCYTTTKTSGWCCACGFKLVNPVPNLQQRTRYYIPQPITQNDNYRNYCHYACSQSHLLDYTTVRYNAVMCLYHPLLLSWGVSQNNAHHGRGHKWTYTEVIDLFVAMRLSGQLEAPNKQWNLVMLYAPILQLTGRNVEQIKKKFEQMQLVYAQYFTPVFLNTELGYHAELNPVP